jgi:hypothetical protein
MVIDVRTGRDVEPVPRLGLEPPSIADPEVDLELLPVAEPVEPPQIHRRGQPEVRLPILARQVPVVGERGGQGGPVVHFHLADPVAIVVVVDVIVIRKRQRRGDQLAGLLSPRRQRQPRRPNRRRPPPSPATRPPGAGHDSIRPGTPSAPRPNRLNGNAHAHCKISKLSHRTRSRQPESSSRRRPGSRPDRSRQPPTGPRIGPERSIGVRTSGTPSLS